MNKQDIINILVKPTNDCNIDCKYCFDRGMRKRLCGTRMPLETIKHVVGLTGDYASNVEFIWHGGEPTLMGQQFYIDAQQYFYDNYDTEYVQTFQTNGINLINDPSWLVTLEDNSIVYGISYDMMTQETRTSLEVDYDSFIKQQVSENKLGGAITVVNSTNIDKLIDMYEFAKEELGSSYTICFNPIFRTEDSEEQGLEVSTEDFLEKFRDFVTHHILDRDPLAPVERTTDQFLRMIFGDRSKSVCDFSDCRYNWLCVVSNGDVYPCDRAIDKYNLGNILDYDSIGDIFNSPNYELYNSDVEVRLDTHCRPCSYYEFCRGGCNSRHAYYGSEPSASNLNLLLCNEYKGLINLVYACLQHIGDYSTMHHYYSSVLHNLGVYLPIKIGKFLSEKMGTEVNLSLNLDTTESLIDTDVPSSPQFKLFTLFNSCDVVDLDYNGKLELTYVNNRDIIDSWIHEII